MSIMFECKKKAEENNSQSSIESFVINNSSMKTDYIQGDTLDLTGIQIQVILGPLTIDVTQYCTFSPSNGAVLTSDVASITATFLGVSGSTPINVYEIDEIAITTQPIKIQYMTDETLDFSGLVVTGYANNRSLASDITSQCTLSPANSSTVSGEEGTYSVSITFGNLSTSFSYTIQNAPVWDSRGMAYNSWDTIAWYIRNGQTSGKMSVGDTKQITTSDNKTITMQLVSINNGNGSAGQYYPEGTADFISVELIDSLQFSNSDSTSGWSQSSCRTYLNSTRYNTLPSDVKQNIINKTHRYTVGGGNSFTEVSDKLWLPTEWEMYGGNTAEYMQTYENANENKHYTIFADNNARKKKVINSSNYKYWWTSTNNKTNYNYYVCCVDGKGVMSYTSQGMSGNFYVTLCFRIG